MNKIELKELLDLVSAVDGRQITPMVIEAWHPVVATMSLPDAKEALVAARSDENIGRVEPKHILAKFRELRNRRAVEQESEQRRSTPHTSTPCPKCVHKISIINCDTCCRAMSDSTNPDRTFFELTGVRV